MFPREQLKSKFDMATRHQPETVRREKRFEGRTVAITGPSLHGIGGSIATRLAEEGASLFLLALEKPDELIERLEALECTADYFVCDVTDPLAAGLVLETLAEKKVEIDVLINNAGVDWSSPFHSMDEARWREIIEVNFVGVLRMSQAMLPQLEKRKGVIVNISSATGFSGTVGLAAYGASKAAVNSLTQSLAAEYAHRRVRVVGVAPALVRTPMVAPYVENVTAEDWDAIQRCHPLGIGHPEDVAAAVAFLASEEARWISGVTLPLGWIPHWPMPPLRDETAETSND